MGELATTKSPLWWTAYNKVKHHRHTDFERATLKNFLNAVAGLFVAVVHLYPEQARGGESHPAARLWHVPGDHSLGQFVCAFGVIPQIDVPTPP